MSLRLTDTEESFIIDTVIGETKFVVVPEQEGIQLRWKYYDVYADGRWLGSRRLSRFELASIEEIKEQKK